VDVDYTLGNDISLSDGTSGSDESYSPASRTLQTPIRRRYMTTPIDNAALCLARDSVLSNEGAARLLTNFCVDVGLDDCTVTGKKIRGARESLRNSSLKELAGLIIKGEIGILLFYTYEI
jgi:hypothetical protein